MKVLLPFLALCRRHFWQLGLGILLTMVSLLASVGLLSLSGWFLAASALAGSAGMYTFNYMLPGAGVRTAAVIRTLARYLERLVSHDATFKVLKHLRMAIFDKLFPLSPARTRQLRHGDLLNRFVADVETLDHLYLRVISPLIGALLVIIVVGFGLSTLNQTAATVVVAMMLAILVLFPPLFYRLGRPVGQQIAHLSSDYRQRLTHWLTAIPELALYPQQQSWHAELDRTEQHWLTAQTHQQCLNALAQSTVLFLSGITVVLVLLILCSSTQASGATPNTALFVFCVLAAFEALGPVATAFLHLSEVTMAAERLTAITHQTPAVTFPKTATVTRTATGALHFLQVSFRYQPDRPQVIDQLQFSLAAGEKAALLGVTGCGKSTLLQLVTRAWDPDTGHITLNSVPLADYSETQLRQQMSVISQRVAIFNQTLRENLLLAAPQAKDTALADALNDVGLHYLLDGAGLDAWLGEGGRSLSGGEQRRIAIARALLHNGQLWLLDEPLEGLDATTEHLIIQLLQRVTQDKTLLMVTHRLSGLEAMDKICVMESGKIVEQGSHRQLMANKQRYYHFRQRLHNTTY